MDIWPICTHVITVGFRDVFQGGVARLPTIRQPFSGSLKRKPITHLDCHSHPAVFSLWPSPLWVVSSPAFMTWWWVPKPALYSWGPS